MPLQGPRTSFQYLHHVNGRCDFTPFFPFELSFFFMLMSPINFIIEKGKVTHELLKRKKEETNEVKRKRKESVVVREGRRGVGQGSFVYRWAHE